MVNLSLFNESARNRQYADALAPWNQVFETCPSANRAIYVHGRSILHWQLSQATDDATYQQVFDKLMLMFDKRMKYFGDDPRYPTPWIKGLKALDYIVYAKNDELKMTAYQWLKESIDGLGESTEIEALRQFVVLSDRIFANDNAHAEKYIADYLKVNDILEALISKADGTNRELATQYKNGLDIVFAQSGAANCETLDNLYKDRITQNSLDLNYLNKIISFYRRVRCVDSKVYFDAAVMAHKIQPSAESASALASMSMSQEQYQQAINYFEEATRLSESNEDRAEYQFTVAQLYYSRLANYPRTKTHALNSLEYNPANGRAHMIIGLAYAGAKGIFDDPVLAKSVYWVAVDRLVRAKQVDPSLAEDVDRLIVTYSRHFPSKEDIFFKPELQDGKSFYVGGWIGETTICR
jgi:tetratricopeptide (TPR) repeat protein